MISSRSSARHASTMYRLSSCVRYPHTPITHNDGVVPKASQAAWWPRRGRLKAAWWPRRVRRRGGLQVFQSRSCLPKSTLPSTPCLRRRPHTKPYLDDGNGLVHGDLAATLHGRVEADELALTQQRLQRRPGLARLFHRQVQVQVRRRRPVAASAPRGGGRYLAIDVARKELTRNLDRRRGRAQL